VPERFMLEAVAVIGEGLCYIDNDPDALKKARAALRRSAKKALPGNEKSFALTRALIHRSEAKWAVRSKKGPLLRKAVVSAASAEAAEFQSACLLDLSKLAVDEFLAGHLSNEERVDGILTARAALELALFGGSYRRADLALQRLAVLEDDSNRTAQWLRTAEELRKEKRLPAEPRNALYLDLTKAIVRSRAGAHQEALDLMAPYNPAWFAANSLKKTDADFYSRVWAIVR
jgi:hypothetical protein